MDSTLVRVAIGSLQTRHFLTRGAQAEQQLTWPHGPKSVSRFMSEQTMHSSAASLMSPPISVNATAPISCDSVSPWAPHSPRLKFNSDIRVISVQNKGQQICVTSISLHSTWLKLGTGLDLDRDPAESILSCFWWSGRLRWLQGNRQWMPTTFCWFLAFPGPSVAGREIGCQH